MGFEEGSEDAVELKEWLTPKLSDLSDVEPDVLADYVSFSIVHSVCCKE